MKLRNFKITLMSSALAFAAAPVAIAQQVSAEAQVDVEQAMPLDLPDHSWITMQGTVMSPTADTFLLDYASGQIIVELDDWGSAGEAMNLSEGDKVTVTGRIDKDLLETATIEASAVVNDATGQHYFANAADEEDLTEWFAARAAAEGQTMLRGAVKTVNAEMDGFVLDNGAFQVEVDVSELADNPLDMTGTPKVKEGDIVTVSGDVESDLFKMRELQARTIVLMTPDNVELETTASVQQQTQVASVNGAPSAQGETWASDDKPAEASATASATVAANGDLPEEVEMAAEKEGYTTEDLAKAQLAALRAAPPLNPS